MGIPVIKYPGPVLYSDAIGREMMNDPIRTNMNPIKEKGITKMFDTEYGKHTPIRNRANPKSKYGILIMCLS